MLENEYFDVTITLLAARRALLTSNLADGQASSPCHIIWQVGLNMRSTC